MARQVENLVALLERDIRMFTASMAEAQRLFDERAADIERRQTQIMVMMRIHGIGRC